VQSTSVLSQRGMTISAKDEKDAVLPFLAQA
jgi:hypothetical protein